MIKIQFHLNLRCADGLMGKLAGFCYPWQLAEMSIYPNWSGLGLGHRNFQALVLPTEMSPVSVFLFGDPWVFFAFVFVHQL